MTSDKILNLDSQSFDEALKNTAKPMLVDFWAPWCGPCKAITPILEELANDMGDRIQICKVDVDNNQEVASRFNIRAIPTLIIFKDGEVVDQVVGMTNKNDLTTKLKSFA